MYELYYNQRIKKYANGTKIITTFNKTVFNPLHNKKDINYYDREVVDYLPFTDYEVDEDNFFKIREDNLKRAKEKIFDIAFMNNFDYFVTLTFNDDIVNANCEFEVHRVMQNWLKNMVKRYNFKALCVPEYHKKYNRIHFHLLASGDLNLIDSGTVLIPNRDKPVKFSTAKKLWKNESDYKTVYNLLNWKNGYSTVIKFEKCDDGANGTTAIAKYLTKYITKDLTKVLKHYYYAVGHVEREVPTEYKVVPFESVQAPAVDVKGTDLKVKYQTIGIGV